MMRFSRLYFWLRIRLVFQQKSTYKIPAVRGCDSSPAIDSVARGSETLCDGKQELHIHCLPVYAHRCSVSNRYTASAVVLFCLLKASGEIIKPEHRQNRARDCIWLCRKYRPRTTDLWITNRELWLYFRAFILAAKNRQFSNVQTAFGNTSNSGTTNV